MAQSGNTYIEGEFAGIDEVGALILRTADGPKRIATAEVFLMSGRSEADIPVHISGAKVFSVRVDQTRMCGIERRIRAFCPEDVRDCFRV